jgi:hypothetical protein
MSRQTLQLLVRPADELAQELVCEQQALPGLVVIVRDLTIAGPDYRRLLEDIFAADSVSVW